MNRTYRTCARCVAPLILCAALAAFAVPAAQAQVAVIGVPAIPAPVFVAPVYAYAPAPVIAYRPVVRYRVTTLRPVAPVYAAPVYAAPVYAYRPVAPVHVYRPVAPVVAVPAPVYVGRPVLYSPKYYIPGQPVRNIFRAITP